MSRSMGSRYAQEHEKGNEGKEIEGMNKNGDLATMYKTIPAVAGLNKVEGFEPSSLLSHTVSPVTGEERLQLGLAYKKLWFRLACPRGRLQLNRVSLTDQAAVFEAQVYLDCGDANPVSSFVSGCTRKDAPGGRYIQVAQHEAMDVALTDAGFGLQFADICAGTLYCRAGDAEKGGKPDQGERATAAPIGNVGHTGTMVRPFPGVPADSGVKAAPAQAVQPDGARLPGKAAAIAQGQAKRPSGTGQSVPTATMPQGQRVQPVESRQPTQAVAMPKGQGAQPSGMKKSVPAAALPQGQRAQPAGVRQAIPPTVPQKQVAQPARTKQPVQAMPQGQGAQPAGTEQPASTTMQQGQEMQPVRDGNAAQPTVGTIENALPVTGIADRKDAVQSAVTVTVDSMDSLPVPPMGKDGQMAAESVTAAAEALPISGNSPGRGNSQSSIQEAIALLNRQALPADTAESAVGDSGFGTTGNMKGDGMAVPMETDGTHLPVDGEAGQGAPAPRYTSDMSVEEIVSLMTLEEAGKVVVDTGTSKGQTIAEVAERRPPSLKYFIYGGYTGSNNVLRAAAQVMLDSITGQKAG